MDIFYYYQILVLQYPKNILGRFVYLTLLLIICTIISVYKLVRLSAKINKIAALFIWPLCDI